jgi:hypothetical protein
MHGYIDAIAVPMHLSPAGPPPKSAKGKGKGKDKDSGNNNSTTTSDYVYDVVASWSPQEREDMQRKVAMSSMRPSLHFT